MKKIIGLLLLSLLPSGCMCADDGDPVFSQKSLTLCEYFTEEEKSNYFAQTIEFENSPYYSKAFEETFHTSDGSCVRVFWAGAIPRTELSCEYLECLEKCEAAFVACRRRRDGRGYEVCRFESLDCRISNGCN